MCQLFCHVRRAGGQRRDNARALVKRARGKDALHSMPVGAPKNPYVIQRTLILRNVIVCQSDVRRPLTFCDSSTRKAICMAARFRDE